MPRTLITVAFSHFCEKARWALDHAALPYLEQRHLPMLHWAATFGAGAGRTVPVLVSDEGVLGDSTAILRHADRHAPPGRRLLPDAPEERDACEALEEEFDGQLGPDVRRVGYWYALSDRRLMLALARPAAPRWQFETLRVGLPLVRLLMMRTMRIDAAAVAQSLDRVRAAFDRVAAALDGGRGYLVGDRFSAADLTFAALAAPMVLPAQHPVPLPAERFPESMRALWREMRAHPAGAFVLRLYADHR